MFSLCRRIVLYVTGSQEIDDVPAQRDTSFLIERAFQIKHEGEEIKHEEEEIKHEEEIEHEQEEEEEEEEENIILMKSNLPKDSLYWTDIGLLVKNYPKQEMESHLKNEETLKLRERIRLLKEKYLELLGPRNNKTGGKASKARYGGRSTILFGFLDTKQSSKQLWLMHCQAKSPPGKSKTLLSKPLYDERSETVNFGNYSSKPAEHCTSAEKHNGIVPENDRMLCKVCYINELSIVFLPCSHMVACSRCAARLKSCPVCRSGIKEALPANLHE